MSLRDAALAWAARGFRVFPLHPNGKRPTHDGWPEWASSDAATVGGWWTAAPDANIGVLTTGLLVADLDCKDGRQGLATWIDLHGAFDTLTVRTPSGGLHLYYSGADVANSQGEHGGLGPGLDIRSHNGYVVAPGSIVDGKPYTIEIDSPMVPAPRDIVAACRPPGYRAENAAVALVEADNPVAVQMATEAVTGFPASVLGERSIATYKLAAHLRDFGVSEHMCATLMEPWAWRCSPPVPIDDLRNIVANAYLYAQNPAGAKHPEAMFGKVDISPLPAIIEPVINGSAHPALHFGNTIPVADLRPRDWLRHRFLMRGHVTMLLAPGGVGKSLMQLSTALHLAAGVDVFGFKAPSDQWHKSIIYNAEDTIEEMSMRLYALCHALGFDPAVVLPRILLISGKTHGRLRLVTGGKEIAINEDAIALLMQWAMDPEVAMLGMDPMSKLHTAQEIDNGAMTFVMDVMELIAERANVAVLLSHHTGKQSLSSNVRFAGNVDAGRGATSIANSARFAFTLSSMTDEDAQHFGMPKSEQPYYLRLDDAKMNYAIKTEEALWLRRIPVRLWNGEEVGAIDKADLHVRTEALRQTLAGILDEGMVSLKGVAHLKMQDAVAVVRQDPLFSKLPSGIVRARIMTALSEPVTLASGHVLQAVEEGGAWSVVLT